MLAASVAGREALAEVRRSRRPAYEVPPAPGASMGTA